MTKYRLDSWVKAGNRESERSDGRWAAETNERDCSQPAREVKERRQAGRSGKQGEENRIERRNLRRRRRTMKLTSDLDSPDVGNRSGFRAWAIVAEVTTARARVEPVANEKVPSMAKAPLWDVGSGALWSPGAKRGQVSQLCESSVRPGCFYAPSNHPTLFLFRLGPVAVSVWHCNRVRPSAAQINSNRSRMSD